jgi:hypothetical protein
MTNMRWLDEVGLHRLVLAGDYEAFAELMRRFDPLIRTRIGSDAEVAAFWCRRLGDLCTWNPDEGVLAQWLRRAS